MPSVKFMDRVCISVVLVCGILLGPLSEAARSKEITYTKDIAPILWKNCAGCHRPGEVGPFSLLTYEDASKRADFLVEITASRRMPPWKPEPGIVKFMDERRLSDDEISLISQWAANGAPHGNPQDLPEQPQFHEGWQLGEPDLVLKMSDPFEIPASGSDVYRCFVVPMPSEKDQMVSAIEFRPGNRKVVHHAILFLDANGVARKRDGEDGKHGYPSFGGPGIIPTGGLGAWVPGATPRFLPDGIVKYVKKGSDLVMQLHYHPSGKPETDQSVVGVYFSKKPVKKIVTGIAIAQPKLKILANDPHAQVLAECQPLPVDVNVLGISPHMHNLGREFKVTAEVPGKTEEVALIWIKDWDFNWQGAYQFEEPLRLPKGSKIKVQAFYDNSEANPKNPNNPPKTIRWGEQTSDEMCLCGVQVYTDRILDLKQIVAMKGNMLGSGLDGGVPGQANSAKKLTSDAIAKQPVKFPPGGIPIPERFKDVLAQFDSDTDGKLSRAEVDKMPAPMKQRVEDSVRKSRAGKNSK